jgi:hypothetical protein
VLAEGSGMASSFFFSYFTACLVTFDLDSEWMTLTAGFLNYFFSLVVRALTVFYILFTALVSCVLALE